MDGLLPKELKASDEARHAELLPLLQVEANALQPLHFLARVKRHRKPDVLEVWVEVVTCQSVTGTGPKEATARHSCLALEAPERDAVVPDGVDYRPLGVGKPHHSEDHAMSHEQHGPQRIAFDLRDPHGV